MNSFDVDLALKLSAHVHEQCKDVPHDIGIALAKIVSKDLVLFDKCTHPDHIEGTNCSERAVGCSIHCFCCMAEIAIPK